MGYKLTCSKCGKEMGTMHGINYFTKKALDMKAWVTCKECESNVIEAETGD